MHGPNLCLLADANTITGETGVPGVWLEGRMVKRLSSDVASRRRTADLTQWVEVAKGSLHLRLQQVLHGAHAAGQPTVRIRVDHLVEVGVVEQPANEPGAEGGTRQSGAWPRLIVELVVVSCGYEAAHLSSPSQHNSREHRTSRSDGEGSGLSTCSPRERRSEG